ncbi:MAG: M48 family metallopeptidase [Acidobacteria bacterium]|nr:M48 family metallopeptidase [Acidobacteriota bacterium]MCW5970699.1 M48 family metallopeptidase [Blastocatellales bacterium]
MNADSADSIGRPTGAKTEYEVSYGRETIRFTLRRTARRTLSISVHPDLSVEVTAPSGAALEQVKAKVRRRASWILKQQDYFSRFPDSPPPRRFVSGETHWYLGRQYRLKVEEAESEKVRLKAGFLRVNVKRKGDPVRVEALLDQWYSARAQVRFEMSLEKCGASFRRDGITAPQLRLRKMKKRWGSCTTRAFIYLNPELIKAPTHCIDYVVTHELCHLKYPNHGKEFYTLLDRVMPDWKKRKERLESFRS